MELGVKEVGGSPGIDSHPVFSPDGKYIACASLTKPEDQRTWDLWVMVADGSRPAQCITTGGGPQYPRWRLDGKSLVFDFPYEAAGTKETVYIMPAIGGEPKCLVENMPLAYGGTPIPGSDPILFTEAYNFHTIKCDGSGYKKLASKGPGACQIMYLSVSPDGQSVVFAATDWPKNRQPDLQLYLSPLDGSLPPRQITHDDVNGRIGNTNPEWGPDGKRITYSGDVNHPRHAHDTWVNVLGDPHPPCLLIAAGARATWSPDGTKVAFDRWTAKDPGVVFVLELGGKRLPVVKPYCIPWRGDSGYTLPAAVPLVGIVVLALLVVYVVLSKRRNTQGTPPPG